MINTLVAFDAFCVFEYIVAKSGILFAFTCDSIAFNIFKFVILQNDDNLRNSSGGNFPSIQLSF